MSDVTVVYSKATCSSEAFSLAKEQVTPEYMEKLKVSADIKYDEASSMITATGKGFTLTLKFLDGKCESDIKLSLVLRPLKKKIITKLEEKLAKTI